MSKLTVMRQKLDFWVKNNKNVLFVGKHGVGKTAMVKETYDIHKLNWLYFSASTMDPWVDFVGVPREKTDDRLPAEFQVIKELAKIEHGLAIEWIEKNWLLNADAAKKIVNYTTNKNEGLSYLELIRPYSFATGDVEAIFFDEFNRSPKKVRNAVMELMQFKSINGKAFPKLRLIWAAINPDDDEDQTYDVEKLDPAQEDRFHIKTEVPYKPNLEWFRERYTPRIGEAAVQWWDDLSEEYKNLVSPRRLQYAIDVFTEKGDMRDVLPDGCNITKLSTALNSGPITEKLESFMKKNEVEEARSFMKNENNYTSAMKYITKAPTLTEFFIPLLPREKISLIMSEDDKMCSHVIGNSDKIPVFKSVCKEIIDANTNVRLVKRIKRHLTENTELAAAFAKEDGVPEPAFYSKKAGSKNWNDTLSELKTFAAQPATLGTPALRIVLTDKIEENIPEKMTADQALLCLELLGNADSITTTILGMTNHCLAEIYRNTGLDWNGVCTKHGSRFKELIQKIKTANVLNKVNTK